jgi:RNA polymerase sigma-70 factor (ECF subfamily)
MSGRPSSAEAAREWLRELYDAHGAALFRYALMILADRSEAEDVVQQVFVSALRVARDIASPLEYLRRATRNECYSALRRRRREQERCVADDGLLEAQPAEAVDEGERVALSRALAALSPEQREVVHLKVFEGLTFPEMAALLDIPANTAASRYRYALVHLRKALGPGPGQERQP